MSKKNKETFVFQGKNFNLWSTPFVIFSLILSHSSVNAGFFDNLADNLQNGDIGSLLTDAVKDVAEEVAKGNQNKAPSREEEDEYAGTSFGSSTIYNEDEEDYDEDEYLEEDHEYSDYSSTTTNEEFKLESVTTTEQTSNRRALLQDLDTGGLFSGEEMYHKKEDVPFTGVAFIAQLNNERSNTEVGYKNGLLHGENVTWWDNGFKQSRMIYAKSLKHGEHTKWDKKGRIQSTSFYKNDKLDGVVSKWTELGELYYKKEFSKGEEVRDLFLESYGLVETTHSGVIGNSFKKETNVVKLLNQVFSQTDGVYRSEDDGSVLSGKVALTIVDEQGNHSKFLEGYLINGKLQGRTLLYKDGLLRSEQDWIDGKQSGLFSLYTRSFKYKDDLVSEKSKETKLPGYYYQKEQRVDGVRHGYVVFLTQHDNKERVVYFALYNKGKMYYGELLKPISYYSFDKRINKKERLGHIKSISITDTLADSVNIVGSIDKPNADIKLEKLLCEFRGEKELSVGVGVNSYEGSPTQVLPGGMSGSRCKEHESSKTLAWKKGGFTNGFGHQTTEYTKEVTTYYKEAEFRKLPFEIEFLSMSQNRDRFKKLISFYQLGGFDMLFEKQDKNKQFNLNQQKDSKKICSKIEEVKISSKEAVLETKAYRAGIKAFKDCLTETGDHELASKVWHEHLCKAYRWSSSDKNNLNCYNIQEAIKQTLSINPVTLIDPEFKKIPALKLAEIKKQFDFRSGPAMVPKFIYDTTGQIGDGKSCTIVRDYLKGGMRNFDHVVKMQIKRPDGTLTKPLIGVNNICRPVEYVELSAPSNIHVLPVEKVFTRDDKVKHKEHLGEDVFDGYYFTRHVANQYTLADFVQVKDGEVDGKFWKFYKNGVPQAFEEFDKDNKVGIHFLWDKTGYLLKKTTYNSNDTLDVVIYHSPEEFLNQNLPVYRVGEQTPLYDEHLLLNGGWNKIINRDYLQHLPVKSSLSYIRQRDSKGAIIKSNAHGKRAEFWPNGLPRKEMNYNNGTLDGAEISYYPWTGKVHWVKEWDNGKIVSGRSSLKDLPIQKFSATPSHKVKPFLKKLKLDYEKDLSTSSIIKKVVPIHYMNGIKVMKGYKANDSQYLGVRRFK